MHPYLMEQMAKDRWEELQRIGSAAAAARRRRGQWWSRVRLGRSAPVASVVASDRNNPVIDLRDTTRATDNEPAKVCC